MSLPTLRSRRFSITMLTLLVASGFVITDCRNGTSSVIGSSADEFFVYEVLPIIQSKCLSCHGDDPDKIEGGLDLRTARSMARGGESQTELVIAGRPEFSPPLSGYRTKGSGILHATKGTGCAQ